MLSRFSLPHLISPELFLFPSELRAHFQSPQAHTVLSLGCPLIQQKDEVVFVVVESADDTVADGPLSLSAAIYCTLRKVSQRRDFQK